MSCFWRSWPLVGFLAAWLAIPQLVTALQIEPLSIDALTRQADLVLHGIVQSRTCLRDAQGRIYTKVELSICEIWKGAVPGNPFLVVHGGGVLGEQHSTVSGQAQYEVGEEVVVFLVRNVRGEGVTVGLFQGKFHVWEDAVSHRKWARNAVHGAMTMAAMTDGSQPAVNGVSASALELVALKRRVREVR